MNANLKMPIRGILKNKLQSAISIFGLGIGLGCIMLLALLYIHENSFDRYIPDHQRLYRVIQGNDCQTSYLLGDAIKAEMPQVKSFFRYYQTPDVELRIGNNEIVKDKLFAFSDPSIFQCLGIDFRLGAPARSPSEVTISEKTTKKYFNNETAIGKILQVRLNENFIPLTVTGVYNDFPSNSTLSPEFIAYIDLTGEVFGFEKKMFGQYNSGYDEFKNWDRAAFYTYLQLNTSASPVEVTESLQKYKDLSADERRQKMAFRLQPVTDIYMKSNELTANNFTRLGNEQELIYYVAIALMILLVALINYIFLNKAKIDSRLKELGARKALGASRNSILKQIVLESNLIAILSTLPAIAVIMTGIPFINNTLNRTLDIGVFSIWETWPVLIFIVLFAGTFSGILIGSAVSRKSIVLLLNGKTSNVSKSGNWGNSFLSLHFAIFIVLIVSVFALKKQINYALTNFKAIDPSNILICELNSAELSKQLPYIKNEVAKMPGVVASAGSSFIPPFNNYLPVRLQYEGENVVFDGLIMGQGMISLLGIPMVEGETFGEFNPGQNDVVFNESAALKYKLKAGDIFNGFHVKGIVKDFSAHSLRRLIQPMVIIQQHPEKMRLFAIKTTGTNDAAISRKIQLIFKEISPDKLVNMYSLTEQINQFYEHEQNQAKLISAFSLLAVILSVMGLLGLTYNTILRKTKEIGIRKVNGARISEIMIMLNRDFVKWVAITFVIATPIAYYAMHKWLESFAYKTELSWWIFALAGLLALGIALLTVSWQSWRAATRNPVEALRYE
ncbi:MAG TPA: FtsX-like permease family protein [Prolixibacteraceae bacterium]|nr:FtsX-like permease family protein [Prolixibacteraceae bacterium]